ncbi:hypothetical protein ANN_19124 [Periplaneta americana]|uniref:Uncharacterized protein n=1 Tax=Periplaneta americana TaxID=6978 RepID=A0ABQ8S9X2_PERAM|nr:hypothetical protein ANN_19124 [Periplaneta americana]
MDLAFIPLEDLQQTLDDLFNDLKEEVVDFATYTEARRSKRGRRRAVPLIFRLPMWNVTNSSLHRHVTNNVVEGFHSKLGKLIATYHLNIWRYLDGLKNIQQENERLTQR